MSNQDDAAMQAECIVRALDTYLAMFPWPSPMASGNNCASATDTAKARMFLVQTLAATIRMSEPHRSALQRSTEAQA